MGYELATHIPFLYTLGDLGIYYNKIYIIRRLKSISFNLFIIK